MDLTGEEIIDIDTYIFGLLLVRVAKHEPENDESGSTGTGDSRSKPKDTVKEEDTEED